MNKYLVFYTKNASPSIKEFKTLTAAKKFAAKHDALNTSWDSDNWTDFIVKGKIVEEYSGFKSIIFSKKEKNK